MSPRTIQDVLAVMEEMAGLELALAALYRACADQFPSERDFWLAIATQEDGHAESIRRLADLVRQNPQEFRCGRPYNAVAIKTTLSSVLGYTDQVRTRRMPRQRALFAAKDLENSVLEAKYHEIVDTDNADYRATMDSLARDTLAHRGLLADALAKLKA